MIFVYVGNVLHGDRIVVHRVDRDGHRRLGLGLAVVAIVLKHIRAVEVIVGIVSNNVVGDRNRSVRGLCQIRLRNGSAEHLRGRVGVKPRRLVNVRIVGQHRNRNRFVLVYFLRVGCGRWRVVHLGDGDRRNDVVTYQASNILNGIGNCKRSIVVVNRVDNNALFIRRNRNRRVRTRCRHAVDEDFLRRRVRNQIRVGVVTEHVDVGHRVLRHRERIRNRRWCGIDVRHNDRELIGRCRTCRIFRRDGDVRGAVPFAIWR